MPRRKQRRSLNGAPSQYDRSLDAGDPDDVRIDDRSFSELLNFAVQFGSLVRFYDLNDRPDGDWTPFFLTDPTMILASVQSMDLRSLEERFLAMLREARDARGYERKIEILGECLQLILRIGRRIEAWFGGAQINPKSRAARLFAGHVADVIGSDLGHQFRLIKASAHELAARATTEPRVALDFAGFGSLWSSGAAATPLEARAGHSGRHDVDQLISVVDSVFRAFFEALHGFQSLAAKHLPETLEDSNHKPQIALYIAFVRLFETAQQTINTIAARFTSFYYHRVLREKKAGPVPDSVYLTLVFDPAAGPEAASVPAGTQFPAGQEPDGTAILYAADKTVSVTPAAIAEIRSIRLVSGPLYEAPFSPSIDFAESPPPPLAPHLLLGTQIDVKAMNDEAAGKGPADGPLAWPVFGGTAIGTSGIATTTAVTLGFAVSSSYLMLTGGDRLVQMIFHLEHDAIRLLEPNLADLAYATGLTNGEVFEQTLSQAFDLWLSTAAGWFQIASYTCSAEFGSNRSSFSLHFSLDQAAPAIVAFNPLPNAPPPAAKSGADDLNPDPGLPTLKAWLRQKEAMLVGPDGEVATYPLSLLYGLAIESIEIRTETSDLTNLQVSTTSGPANAAATYPVFGAMPVTGSFLQFTNPELFVKIPDSGSLKISLTWFGLPANSDGFTGYYQGYVLGLDGQPSPTPLFDNQTFAGNIRVMNPGMWDLRQLAPGDVVSPPVTDSVFLFRTQDDCSNPIPEPDGALCPVSEFETFVVDKEPPEYYDPASSAIRLTFTEPAYAFGTILYSPNVLNAVVSELPKPGVQTAAVPACQPLADAANSLAACLPAEGQPPPSKDAVRQVAQQTQEKLIYAAQTSLSRSLSPLGEDVASWVQQTFTVSGSNAAPYRAQKIRARLQSALAAIEANLPGHTSPPGLPRAAAAPIRNCISTLQPVILIQQALDHCGAESDQSWSACIQTQLAACRQKLSQAYSDCAQKTQSLPYPNPPWIPQAKGLSVGYRAHCKLSRFDADDSAIRFYHLLPYGGYEDVSFNSGQILLLPITSDGSLELGFSGLDAPQQLSVLVQMCAGGAAEPTDLSWQYLSSNTWLPLNDAAIPADTTNGLQNTGILTLTLPAANPGAQTVASTTSRWLRAITTRPDDFPEAIGFYPHPVAATWVSGSGGSGQHLSRPLPPYTIKSSAPSLAGIKTINQPIESFGGRPAENDKTFRIRLSERLRHKDRAILAWDYERLVLEQFPFIWKVKALPATSTTAHHQPGRVLVVVVTGPGGVQISDPTEPLVPADMLEHIRQALTARASPFACIQVVNPNYVRIHVTAEVMFQDSSEGGEGIDRLNTDLVQYLSPWFYDAERASTQGRYASEDAITQFIQTRAYVAALVDIRFDYDPPPSSLDWYFLTSAKSHSITQADYISDSKGAVQPCSQ